MDTYTLVGLVTLDINYGIYKDNDLFYTFEEEEKHFEDSTKYRTVVMSDSYFRNVLNSVPLLDRFNIIVSNSLKESKELNDTVDTKGYSVLFTCSVNPVDWLTAIDLIYDTEKNPDLIYDTSVLYVIGDMKLFSSLYKQIKVYFVTQIFNNFNCDKMFTVLSEYDSIYNIDYGLIAKNNDYSYSIDISVKPN